MAQAPIMATEDEKIIGSAKAIASLIEEELAKGSGANYMTAAKFLMCVRYEEIDMFGVDLYKSFQEVISKGLPTETDDERDFTKTFIEDTNEMLSDVAAAVAADDSNDDEERDKIAYDSAPPAPSTRPAESGIVGNNSNANLK